MRYEGVDPPFHIKTELELNSGHIMLFLFVLAYSLPRAFLPRKTNIYFQVHCPGKGNFYPFRISNVEAVKV